MRKLVVFNQVHLNVLDLLQQLGLTLAPPGAGAGVHKDAPGEER